MSNTKHEKTLYIYSEILLNRASVSEQAYFIHGLR